MKNYSKPLSVIAKVIEIFMWVGCILLVLALGYSFFQPSFEENIFVSGIDTFNVMGLNAENVTSSLAAFRILLTYSALVLGLNAMIFRNIGLITRQLSRSSSFGENNTPFTKDTVRMVREIGIFSISISVLALFFSWIVRLVSGGTVEISADLNGIFAGIVVLYLSLIFKYGEKLQEETEGLV